jgi:hypothetical protein
VLVVHTVGGECSKHLVNMNREQDTWGRGQGIFFFFLVIDVKADIKTEGGAGCGGACL